MKTSASILISTCDKFSDLWEAHISFFRKNWSECDWKVYMVTDKPTERVFDGVEIIVAQPNMDFPLRIQYALDYIDTDHVLVTLDDYFLIGEIEPAKLDYLAKRAERERIDYLLLYDRRKTDERKYEPVEKLFPIDLTQKYAVNLYPAIWSKEFLRRTVKGNQSPWQYEPSLTETAREVGAVCMFSHAGAFVILDVVRKGKVLHKAKAYLKKCHVDIGDRPTIKRRTEIKLAVMDRISWYAPRPLFRAIKRAAKLCGMTFYSDD